MSPFPFNNDGVTEARIAGDILSSGHLTYPESSYYVDTYSILTPAYNVILAFSSSITGADTFAMSQTVVALLSILVVVGGYAISIRITRNFTGALSTALVLGLLGTFVFLTGSAWKASLGVAMLMFLAYAYMNRSERRFLLLELIVLASLPLAYHLATVLAYLALAYLTLWSLSIAMVRGRISCRHLLDVAVICTVSIGAYVFYAVTSFERLLDYGSSKNVFMMIVMFLVLSCVAGIVLIRKNSMRGTLAPIVGVVVASVVFVDYHDPVFPYTQGFASNVILLGFIYSLVVAIGWFGLESLVRSDCRYRAIPIGFLLPILTLLLFSITSGIDLESHRVFFRTFDYADVSISLGVGVAVSMLRKKMVKQILVVVLVLTLLISFPFAYATSTLLGDRHDTQQYEVDAIAWVYHNTDSPTHLRTDERLSYVARALYDFGKDPYLPSRIVSGNLSAPDVMNLMLSEWMVTGVNDYPRGHPVLDDDYVSHVLDISNVVYVGGPMSDSLVLFQTPALDAQ